MDYDFEFFLVTASVLTGLIWAGWVIYLKLRPSSESKVAEPWPVEYARSFFPVIFIVLLLRSFLVEPFRIPSGSMMPTLLIGDFILVNKFTYGVRLPVLHTKIIENGEPQRGDIVVFRFPNDPTVDYIKRVIGLPGDRIQYVDKKIIINGKPVHQTPLSVYQGVGKGKENSGAILISEDLDSVSHDILIRENQPSQQGRFIRPEGVIVPEGHYFVMGDNRDNSNDGRFWGFVPEGNLVGRAFFRWMSLDWELDGFPIDFSRIGNNIK
jgi:signal peptidase I